MFDFWRWILMGCRLFLAVYLCFPASDVCVYWWPNGGVCVCVCWWPNGSGVWWIDYECFVGLISRECLACVADPLIWPSRARGTHRRPTPSRKFVEGDEQNAMFWWGHFRQVWPKKLTCRVRGCISVSSNGTIGRKGVDCKFLQLSWVQLKQTKHWYQNCKLM
jgi:hypothetical protein